MGWECMQITVKTRMNEKGSRQLCGVGMCAGPALLRSKYQSK